MARVFENSMVAHVWAQRRQDSGRSNNGQFYFTGPVLFSYGSHFVAGVFDGLGRAWLNADSYSPTTGKHMSYARRAVQRPLYAPDLTGLRYALQDIGQRGRADYVKRELTAYLAKNWESFSAQSESGEALWSATGARSSWATEYAKRERKRDKANAVNAKRARKHALAHAKELAAIPLDMVRLRMIEMLSNASDWNKERVMRDQISYFRDAHRDSEPGKVRAALWERVKLSKEIGSRLARFSGNKYAKTRGAAAMLRRIWAGDYGAAGPLNYAIAERQALRDLAAAHMSSAMRKRGEARLEAVHAEIERLEAEKAMERYEAQRAACEAWRSGESVQGRYSLQCDQGGALLRAIEPEIDGCTIKGGTLETSQGASVPLRHAFAVFAFVRDCKAAGLPWLPITRLNDGSHARHGPAQIRVGHFHVDEIDACGNFRAGCHSIKWGEVERLAKALGVLDCAPVPMEQEA